MSESIERRNELFRNPLAETFDEWSAGRDSIAWIPGENFDPHDPEEMEIMHSIWDGECFNYQRRLEAENQYLRQRIAELTGE